VSDEPEDTVPFTHRPYGSDREDDNPMVSPSGPAAQPSGPSYSTPPPPPPPSVGPMPYGTAPGQEQWQAAWAPAYGAPVAGSLDHKGATTALVLGIISVFSLLVGLFCCLTLPGVFCAPFAWAKGAKAKREIEAAPGTYGNLTSAVSGMWMGIVMTILGAVVILGFAAIIAFIGITDWSLV
jgi:hypothetical protein